MRERRGEVSCAGHSLRLVGAGPTMESRSERWATFTLLPRCPEAQKPKQVRGYKRALRYILALSCPVFIPPMVVYPRCCLDRRTLMFTSDL